MIQENTTNVIPETPAEGFALLDDALYGAESLSVYTDVERRNPGGDLYTVTAYYICPEGRRVDVDAYVATSEVLTVEMDFDNEIPDEEV